ncbi:MAG: 6,7-dimethyl-8-ribityllumazine synthase [Candidatus Thermoplasmatota archaeon]|jgi:6,7-dimethyl-8-ribityllumazine synthase|nr:6,7-dimethyl-8-ribityllumazine synthase [Candidatus Thermoplasmatota archaeon]MDP7265462.1 6,7-dimethyl-8-ribityllumazine synthase [Candidatus Thermoplasmatota archaeon]
MMKIGIVAAEFHYDITSMMVERARAHAEFLGAEVTEFITVPGCYDIPLAAKKLLSMKDIDAVVALGAVLEGETGHDEVVMGHASRKLIDLSLDMNKPVGLGITGPGMSRLQAEERIDRAKSAVEAVVKLHKNLAKL